MISTQKIKTIAHFEMKTLFRSWFFRIFAGLAVLGLGIFNIAVFIESSGAPWLYRALPGNIPYVNLLVLNLGQAIVAIFLASEFLKQDRKNDTVEVIYARSMTNAEYIIGKSIGILYVFLILNLFILLMGIGFSFISSDSSKGIGEYFLYPLLISLPTLVFIFGLSFSMMILFKNQAITFIVLLGYIAITIFYLDNKFYHLFDYIAYKVPMMHSSITGFGNFQEIVIHRSIYFCLGLGLIFLTIFKLNRLPQSKKFTSLPLFIGILFLAFGGLLINKYVSLKKENIEIKLKMIAFNNQYFDSPRVDVFQNNITLDHLGETLHAVSDLSFQNASGQEIDTIIFKLNPSLKILSAKLDNQSIEFERELQLILLLPSKPISINSMHKLSLEYEGTISESTHFLDLDPENFENDFNLEIFRVRKRFAFLTDDFVCLTQESLWYPTSGVSYATDRPVYFSPDFTTFTLQVHTRNDLTAISQGGMLSENPGDFVFKTDFPLTQISLLIGDYQKYSVKVDSVEYGVFAIKGNDFFKDHFMDISDSLPGMIGELKNEYETAIGLDYPFKRFYLAEVPVHFALDKHIYSISSDAVQPEIMFYPEKGVTLEETDFKKRKKRVERRSKRDNEELSPEDVQSRIFKRFVRGNYMANHQEWYMYNEIINRNTFTLFPNYYNFVSQLKSENWPMLDLSLATFLKERNTNAVQNYRWFNTDLSNGERINLELKNASLQDLMKNGLQKQDKNADRDEQIYLNDVITAKGDQLFSLFRARYGDAKFNAVLNQFIKTQQHRSFSFQDLNEVFKSNFDSDIYTEISDWYEKINLPGFLVKDVESYKVLDGEYTKYQLRFKISNPEAVDGMVTFNADLDNQEIRNEDNQVLPDFSQKLFIPAGQAKEIGFVFNNEPSRINIFTHISENLPNNLIYDFTGSGSLQKRAIFEGSANVDFFNSIEEKNAIIIDNEDEGFSFHQDLHKSFLKKLVDKNKKEGYKYKGIRWWNPPAEWIPVVRSGFYGKYVRSGFYTRSGSGERTASWNANLKKAAFYDVYCHIEKINVYRRSSAKKANYNFKVHHEEGIEDIVLQDTDVEDGWNYLGTFFITPETSIVEMTNKSHGKMIAADAIKWIKN
jgi:ABC-type transport system involved in multi-copper enzyme maturation permease subunit